jgi:hypothetical protein
MTWKEFKEEVDKQLKENDISEDTQIDYIDTYGDEITVSQRYGIIVD